MIKFRNTASLAVVASLAAFSAGSAALADAERLSTEIGDAPAAPVTYEITEIATGLETAASIAFLPSGDMLVAEKAGRLRVIRDGELLSDPVAGVPEVHFRSQAGLFDVVLHPEFEENSIVYLSYAHPEGRRNTLRLARARFEPTYGSGSLQDLEVIFTGESWRTTSAHYGGRIAFLSDGTLLLTTGDGYRHREEAQKLDNHFGKIIRLNDDGTVPADNPFVDTQDALPEIWSYGHRNPQGIVFDDKNSIVYAHEHGPRGGDEVNIIEKGNNYGWPVICYCIDYSGAQITPFSQMDGMEQSIVHYEPSIAPSGFAIYDGDQFPDWQGDLFIGALAHEHVRHLELESGQFGAQQEHFGDLGSRIRDVRVGPDGFMYVLTDKSDASVFRVSPR
ncbi:MAG: PQQ-dependent sugar dehydrogenase [Aquisalinus sp.]|nr:PQQ-dependent sugar dehydrogenase [Aquisalinus sp.]